MEIPNSRNAILNPRVEKSERKRSPHRNRPTQAGGKGSKESLLTHHTQWDSVHFFLHCFIRVSHTVFHHREKDSQKAPSVLPPVSDDDQRWMMHTHSTRGRGHASRKGEKWKLRSGISSRFHCTLQKNKRILGSCPKPNTSGGTIYCSKPIRAGADTRCSNGIASTRRNEIDSSSLN